MRHDQRGRRLAEMFVLALFSLFGVSGCGIGAGDAASATAVPGVSIKGHVHGGAFPIQQALVTLMETQSTGYGQPGKVLEQVKSDKNGYFTFDSNWTCDAGQYAYMVVSSGHTIASATTSNNNVLQVGVIGACSTDLATAAEINGVNVFLSELSTVAAAYALGNFITISTNPTYGLLAQISSPAANNSATPGCTGLGSAMTCTAAGLAHAFANAYNLVDSVRYDGSFPSGAARLTVPGNAQGTVPQALLNTLGNILQSCVDSNGVANSANISGSASDGSHCGDLFEYATVPGGAVPLNTLQVALNMAKYPNNNVDQLFNLQPRAVFFTPALTSDKLSGTSTLMAYSVSIFYFGTGLAGDTGYYIPVLLTLDAQDNEYTVSIGGTGSTSYSTVSGISAGGTGLFVGTRYTSVPQPNAIAADSVGNVWVTDDRSGGNVQRLATSGANAGSYTKQIAVPNGYAAGLAIDASNNVWVSRDAGDANQSLFQFQASNNFASTNFQICFGAVCIGTPPQFGINTKRLFVDAKQNVFGVTSGATATARIFQFPFASNGPGTTAYFATLGTTGGFGIAMNSADQAYLPLKGELDTANGFTNGNFYVNSASQGVHKGPSATGVAFNVPNDVTIDGAGSVFWSDLEGPGEVFALTPVSNSVSTAPLTSVYPCYPQNNQCLGTTSNLRSMSVDSSGDLWYIADSTAGVVVQTMGLAANSWPLLSYAHGGVAVQ